MKERGATSVYFLLFTLVMLGLLTMAADFGRFYVIQSELQTAADAAALAAATKLAGTMSSTNQAELQWQATFNSENSNDNRFNLRLNQIFPSGTLIAETGASYFSTLPEAIANAGGESGGIDWGSLTYPKYARVQISAQAPVLFAPFLNRTPGRLPTITVSAIAGVSAPLCTAAGIDALAVVDPSGGTDTDNFPLTPGDYYTLSQSSSQAALDSTDSTVQYVILDRFPNGIQDTSLLDDLLFELAAGGMSNAAGLVPSGSVTIDNIDAAYGSPNSFATMVLQGTTTAASQDVLCGLNLRFGIDPSMYDTCDSGTSVDFPQLAPLFTAAADTDPALIASGPGGQQDFAVDYCPEGVCNFRRVLTVPVVDAASSLKVLNFRQFLLEPSPPSATAAQGIDPTAANGSFRAQYIGSPVPVRAGTVGGSCTISSGVGRVVLH
jgi:hypothetical protein